ncbi:MAG: CsiV family protein, partial [Pseudomonadota bacterium]
MAKQVRSIRWLALLCGAVAMAPVRAQEAAVDETPPLPEYRVELIVFEYLDSKGADEDWTADPLRELTATAPVVDSDTSIEGSIDETDETVAAPAVEVEFRYRPVSDDVLSFGEYVDQMRRSRDFRPLIHTAWEQPGYPRDVASPLDLARIVRLPERLNGTVTLWLGR